MRGAAVRLGEPGAGCHLQGQIDTHRYLGPGQFQHDAGGACLVQCAGQLGVAFGRQRLGNGADHDHAGPVRGFLDLALQSLPGQRRAQRAQRAPFGPLQKGTGAGAQFGIRFRLAAAGRRCRVGDRRDARDRYRQHRQCIRADG